MDTIRSLSKHSLFPLLRGAIAVCALWGTLSLAGCSAQKRYEVLAFFFDGVPKPGSPPKPQRQVSSQYIPPEGEVSTEGPVGPRGFFHAPYVKNRCRQCHPPQRALYIDESTITGKLCFQCHEHDPFQEKIASYSYVHGPVAVEACLMCHDPHESLYEGILRKPDPQLCLQCHEEQQLLRRPWHAELGTDSCLPCHDPHGGKDRSFLRGEAQKG